jgi:hypothetical protein
VEVAENGSVTLKSPAPEKPQDAGKPPKGKAPAAPSDAAKT